jgi:hypothetical protein
MTIPFASRRTKVRPNPDVRKLHPEANIAAEIATPGPLRRPALAIGRACGGFRLARPDEGHSIQTPTRH